VILALAACVGNVARIDEDIGRIGFDGEYAVGSTFRVEVTGWGDAEEVSLISLDPDVIEVDELRAGPLGSSMWATARTLNPGVTELALFGDGFAMRTEEVAVHMPDAVLLHHSHAVEMGLEPVEAVLMEGGRARYQVLLELDGDALAGGNELEATSTDMDVSVEVLDELLWLTLEPHDTGGMDLALLLAGDRLPGVDVTVVEALDALDSHEQEGDIWLVGLDDQDREVHGLQATWDLPEGDEVGDRVQFQSGGSEVHALVAEADGLVFERLVQGSAFHMSESVEGCSTAPASWTWLCLLTLVRTRRGKRDG